MKTKIFLGLFIFLFIVSHVIAQSDYETVQRFKAQYRQIEESIKNVSSTEECGNIRNNIDNLRNEFIVNKSLLDKALYPENLESSFAKIENAFASKKADVSQIKTLSTQVDELQTQVAKLNEENESLLKQIDELKAKTQKDQATITDLNRLIAQLKGNINQRDLLVHDLVDSLLAQFIKTPSNISSNEAKMIQSKIKKENLFYNIERTITDNIRFVKVTQLSVDDFSQMIKQYHDFDKAWKQMGPKLSSVYLSKKQKKSEIDQIDSLFIAWNNEINNQIWESIHKLFAEKNINLTPFNSAGQFVGSVSAFIQDEIKNVNTKSKNDAENTYHDFADSVYFKTVDKKWIPLLIDNRMMTLDEKSSIESKIEIWKNEFSSLNPAFYIIPLILIIAATVIIFKKKKSSQNNPK